MVCCSPWCTRGSALQPLSLCRLQAPLTPYRRPATRQHQCCTPTSSLLLFSTFTSRILTRTRAWSLLSLKNPFELTCWVILTRLTYSNQQSFNLRSSMDVQISLSLSHSHVAVGTFWEIDYITEHIRLNVNLSFSSHFFTLLVLVLS